MARKIDAVRLKTWPWTTYFSIKVIKLKIARFFCNLTFPLSIYVVSRDRREEPKRDGEIL